MSVFDVEVRLTGVEGMTKKQVNDALKRAMYALGLQWRRKYLPLHFGEAAKQRYKYKPRAGERGNPRRGGKGYHQRKQRFLKHTRPLEYSGDGKREALNGMRLVHSTRDKVRVPLPRKFNFRNPKSKINMADEIRTVRHDELRDLNEFLVSQIDRELSPDRSGNGPARARAVLRDARGRFLPNNGA